MGKATRRKKRLRIMTSQAKTTRDVFTISANIRLNQTEDLSVFRFFLIADCKVTTMPMLYVFSLKILLYCIVSLKKMQESEAASRRVCNKPATLQKDSIGRNPTAESDTEKVAPLRPYLQNERQQKDKDAGVRND